MFKNKNPDYLMKMGFVITGIIVVTIIILGSWIWNLIFDPSSFDVNQWANNAIFNGAISLAMMVLGFIAINENNKSKENGRYQKRLDAFNDIITNLMSSGRIVYFDQFISWYAERQVREKKIKYLTKHGMPRMEAEIIVDYATMDDIPIISGLEKEKTNNGKYKKPEGRYGEDIVRTLRDGKEVLIPAIRDTLAAYIEEVLNGTITVEVEDASYYTTADKNKESNLTSLERAQATEKERIKSLRWSFFSKTLAGLIYITIFSLLAVDLNQGMATGEAIWNLIIRFASATVGFIAGGFAGSTNARFLYKWLGDKMRVVNEYNKFMDCGEFVPKSYNESSQERIKKVHDKEEERLKNIIVPEIVEEGESTKTKLLTNIEHSEM